MDKYRKIEGIGRKKYRNFKVSLWREFVTELVIIFDFMFVEEAESWINKKVWRPKMLSLKSTISAIFKNWNI